MKSFCSLFLILISSNVSSQFLVSSAWNRSLSGYSFIEDGCPNIYQNPSKIGEADGGFCFTAGNFYSIKDLSGFSLAYLNEPKSLRWGLCLDYLGFSCFSQSSVNCCFSGKISELFSLAAKAGVRAYFYPRPNRDYFFLHSQISCKVQLSKFVSFGGSLGLCPRIYGNEQKTSLDYESASLSFEYDNISELRCFTCFQLNNNSGYELLAGFETHFLQRLVLRFSYAFRKSVFGMGLGFGKMGRQYFISWTMNRVLGCSFALSYRVGLNQNKKL